MRALLAGCRRLYGSHPLHLLTMLAGFAVLGYVVATVGPASLFNPEVWWKSIAVWFAAAIVAHDLVVFPLYALADRVLTSAVDRPGTEPPRVPVANYIRIPALASGLTLLLFLPGIIKQGATDYLTATGQTQEPFLGRWLLLTAVVFVASAVAYGVRLALAHRRPSAAE